MVTHRIDFFGIFDGLQKPFLNSTFPYSASITFHASTLSGTGIMDSYPVMVVHCRIHFQRAFLAGDICGSPAATHKRYLSIFGWIEQIENVSTDFTYISAESHSELHSSLRPHQKHVPGFQYLQSYERTELGCRCNHAMNCHNRDPEGH
jgi:hypothetical protein